MKSQIVQLYILCYIKLISVGKKIAWLVTPSQKPFADQQTMYKHVFFCIQRINSWQNLKSDFQCMGPLKLTKMYCFESFNQRMNLLYIYCWGYANFKYLQYG